MTRPTLIKALMISQSNNKMKKNNLFLLILLIGIILIPFSFLNAETESTEIKTEASISGQAKGREGKGDVSLNASSSQSLKVKRAEVHSSTTASSTANTARLNEMKKKANQEINRRIAALNRELARIQSMKRIGDASKSSTQASIQAEITALNTLKAKIDADTDVNVLKTDIQSITKSYRVYALVMPQASIQAAAARIKTIADAMMTLGGKLQVRITEAKTAGKNISDLDTLMSDYNAKIADAKVQADGALSLIVNLTPDNGDKAKMQANLQALKDARTKIKAGQEDLRKARQEGDKIVKRLRELGFKKESPTSTTSPSTSPSSTPTPTASSTPTVTPTLTPTPSNTPTVTPTPTASSTPTVTPTTSPSPAI